MSHSVDAPPILRFVLGVLEARTPQAVATAAVEGLAKLFAGATFSVRDGDRVIASCGATDGGVAISLRVGGDAEFPVVLRAELPSDPDLPILRQQLIDLVAVIRRAWNDRQQLAEEQRRAREDVLTGLDNRRAIAEFLESALQESRATRRPLTVMLVDLDHFKLVNDTQGHPAGDDVLQLAASCFRAHLRPSDRVCRWGGDEFLLAIPGLSADRAMLVAERLRTAFAGSQRARGTTMTIGIADSEGLAPHEDATELIAQADACLVEAKRCGRNRTRQATPRRHAS